MQGSHKESTSTLCGSFSFKIPFKKSCVRKDKDFYPYHSTYECVILVPLTTNNKKDDDVTSNNSQSARISFNKAMAELYIHHYCTINSNEGGKKKRKEKEEKAHGICIRI